MPPPAPGLCKRCPRSPRRSSSRGAWRASKKGVPVSWDTVTKVFKAAVFKAAVLKAARCTYRRARRVPPKTPPSALQQARRRALAKFHRLTAHGQCDVLDGDESGFSRWPNLPSAWQASGHSWRRPAHPTKNAAMGWAFGAAIIGWTLWRCRDA